MRKYYWYATAYIKKHGFIFLSSVIGAILVFSLIVPYLADRLEQKKKSYIGIVGDYTLTTLPPIVANKLSAGLTKVEPDGSTSPVLAERWSVEQEGKVYRFVLKDNLYWQDGQPVTPENLQYKLKDTEVVITNQDIVFRPPDTYAPFPTLVSQPVFREGKMKQFWFFSRPTLIGIGKYKISNYKLIGHRLEEIIVESLEEKFIYRFYLTEADAVTSFKRGEVDILERMFDISKLQSWDTVDITTQNNKDQYLAVFLNHNDPRFAQKNVRQALNYALEKRSDELRTLGPIHPDSWAYLDGGKRYDKSIERAIERILAEMPAVALQFELVTSPLFVAKADKIKQEWETFGQQAFAACQTAQNVEDKALCDNVKIGVKVTISSFPDTNNFEALLLGQQIPGDPDQYSLWHSGQSTNIVGYKNTRIDNLLEKGRQTLVKQERLEIYQEFQQFFLEDSPIIFLEYIQTFQIERK